MSNIADTFNAFLSLPGLRGFWPLSSFDESGNAYDVSGWGGTLAYNGGATGPTYNINPRGTGYLDFDGTGDFLSFADHAHFDILGTESYVATAAKGLTIGGWFWFDNFSASSGCLSKFAGTSGQHSYRLYGTTDATIGFQVSSDGTNTGLFNGESVAQSTGKWLFVVGRYDPSTELAVFVNKVKTTNTTSIPAAIFNSSSGFRIGAAAADNSGLLNGRGALCFLCAEVVSDALLDELYDASEPLFNIAISEAETVTLAETVSRRLVHQPKPTQTVTLTEGVTVRVTRQIPDEAETVTLTEAKSIRMALTGVIVSETVTFTEAKTVTLALTGVTEAETVTLTETKTVSIGTAQVQRSETVTLSEAVTVKLARQTSQDQAVTLSEAQSVTMVRAAALTETVTLSEAATVTVSTSRVSQAETVTLTETATVSMARRVSSAEIVTLAEAQTVSMTRQASAAETVTLTEAQSVTLAGHSVSASDAVTLTEAQAVSMTAAKVSVAETITLSETGTTVLLVSVVGQSEAVTLTETVSLNLTGFVNQNETVTLTEAQSIGVTRQTSQNETVTLSEVASLGMARSVSQAETVTLTETVSRNLIGLVGATETVTLSETVSLNLVGLLGATETVTLTEAVTASMARQTSQNETVSLTEAVTANMPRSVSQNETVTLTEAQNVTVATARVSTAETVTLTEAQTVRAATTTVSQNQAVTLTEAQSLILADRLSAAETITLSETGTTVLLVSVVGQGETVTLTEGVTVVLAAFSASVGETVTVGEIVLVNAGSGLLITVSEIVTLAEATGASVFEIVTIILYDTLALSEVLGAPLFSVTDTLTLSDNIVGTVTDTLTLADEVTIGNVTMVIEDTLTFSEVLELDGPAVTPPAAAATSELDYRPVLKLLYGNDKRNPVRELDLAQLAPGSIHLMAGGFAPGAGERNELWSGESIRFDGQKKLAESRKNSQLAVTCVLKTGGSQAALSYFGRKISRFFAEAKQHQLLGQNHTVWLEYRWSDGLPDLATPTFGQLSNYYEVFSATSPKWPDSLHDDLQSLTQGVIADVLLNITGSPAPEGLKQQAAIAAGTISLQDKGVLIASGASSKLHWAGYTSSGLTGNFTITGWITLNAVWGSGNKDVFDYYVDASNRIRIIYDAGNNRWTITKIVSGSTFTANSSTDAVTNGDDVHLQLVQDSTTLRLYVNGVSAVSATATATMTDGGTVALGCPATGTLDGVDVILDGWRILPDDITATQALALYEAELPIKQDGGQVGPPPYFWTIDGLGQVNGADDSTYYNWGIVGGIGGDLEAKTDIRLNMSDTASKTYWLGVKSQDETFVPSDYIWFEATGGSSVADAPSSEGSYHRDTGTALSFTPSQTGLDPELILGKYHWLCRVRSSGPAVATVTPGWFFTNSIPRPVGRTISVTNGAFKVLSFGDTFVETDAEPMIKSSPNISLALRIAVAAPTGVVFDTDFSFLLPAPFAKISQPDHASAVTPSASQPLVIEDGHAHVYTSAGRQTDRYEYQGDRLVTRPGKYNYLFLVRLDVNEEFLRTNLTSIAVYVTPR